MEEEDVLQFFDVGVDTNMCLLAVHARHGTKTIPGSWASELLQRKESFKDASTWELYVLAQCLSLTKKLTKCMKGYCDHLGIKRYKVYAAVEQQRGRVKSIVEAGLVTSFLAEGWTVAVPHPLTWKKKVGLSWGGGNTENKKLAVSKEYEKLKLYRQEYCPKLPPLPPLEEALKKMTKKNEPDRIHDLCDASLMSEYSYKCREGL